MDAIGRLNDAVAYIEENLCGEINMECVARIACVSGDGFSRYFSFMTGMTVREYVRRRRLTLAAYDLRRGLRVTDAAMRYGYNSAGAFGKAFTRQHGFTPAQAREPGCEYRVFPPVSFAVAVRGAQEMRMRMVRTDAIEVYGLTRRLDADAAHRFQERSVMWDEKMDFLPARVSADWEGVWYGVWDAGVYAIARERTLATGEGLERLVIPGGTYAAFCTERGAFAETALQTLREQIFTSWLPDSGYEPTADYEVEVYHLQTDRALRRRNRYYEIWVPVRERRERG